jgi:hypothetical protein
VNITDPLDEPRRELVAADAEIDRVFLQYSDPITELLNRYGRASGEKKDTFVLALIGKVMVYRARMKRIPCVSSSPSPSPAE